MELKTNFEFDKYGIGVEDIKTEAEQLLKQGNETQERKANRFPVEVFPLPVQQVITGIVEIFYTYYSIHSYVIPMYRRCFLQLVS